MTMVHAEWTKFRTVRGWVVGMLVAVLATVAVGFLQRSTCSDNGAACPGPPVGPGGEAVTDAFYFVRQPLTGNGTITVRVTSLTGEYSASGAVRAGQGAVNMTAGTQPWSKAGIIIKASTAQGSAYAAMMVTGSNGVRMQWNYTGDIPGLPGEVSASSPRWLRLARSGDKVTGWDSADGTHWTRVGTSTLTGLPSTAQAGLFAASPGYSVTTSSGIGGYSDTGGPALATAVFSDVSLSWPSTGWTGDQIGGDGPNGAGLNGSLHQSNAGYTVTGSGDIAPDTGGSSVADALVGTFAGLIAVIVIAAVFITTEYRRGLIRVTLAASPRRGRVLAAKAVVIAAVSFVAGLVAITIAAETGLRNLRSNGVPVLPVSTFTMVRILGGSAVMIAVAAVLALAIGMIVRRSAIAVATVIGVIFVPYLLGTFPGLLSGGAQDWLLRITPAAAFAIQQAFPAYHQVTGPYTAVNHYYPLSPWAGLAVECGWAAAALTLAAILLRRRDA